MLVLELLFLLGLYLIFRHVWRNRTVYVSLIRFFSQARQSFRPAAGGEKRIVACPHCGSMPEVTSERCSRCGRIV